MVTDEARPSHSDWYSLWEHFSLPSQTDLLAMGLFLLASASLLAMSRAKSEGVSFDISPPGIGNPIMFSVTMVGFIASVLGIIWLVDVAPPERATGSHSSGVVKLEGNNARFGQSSPLRPNIQTLPIIPSSPLPTAQPEEWFEDAILTCPDCAKDGTFVGLWERPGGIEGNALAGVLPDNMHVKLLRSAFGDEGMTYYRVTARNESGNRQTGWVSERFIQKFAAAP